MARVDELLPGDLVTLGGQAGVFISAGPHPAHPSLALVIWRMRGGTWSLDALSWAQEVGDVKLSSAQGRWARVQEAFRG